MVLFSDKCKFLSKALNKITGMRNLLWQEKLTILGYTMTKCWELDNSAQFYGVINDVPNISKITFSTDIDNSGIGVNFLSIVTVPEPSLWMGLLFMAGCGLISKKNKKSF